MEKIFLTAKLIVLKLFQEGYTAYFAGGWVRDFLLGKSSTEIDIATSAPPEKILSLFPKALPLGVAFGVVVVIVDELSFEISTFRKDLPYYDGRHPSGVDFSTPEKDAKRRDFTINGMFYDPLTKTIYDYVGGKQDLKQKVIRTIGDPSQRFSEDRLRMIRAVRFATQLQFHIEEQTSQAIMKNASSLFPSVSIERVWKEFEKMAESPHFDQALLTMHRLQLLSVIFPDLQQESLSSLEQRVSSFPYFPYPCPTIIYLLQLFPHLSPEESLSLCQYLKVSKTTGKYATFFIQAASLFSQASPERIDWAYFYAHPFSSLFLDVEKAKTPFSEREAFAEKHEKQKRNLKKHIERLQKQRPLVYAALLQKEGIPPGKPMGVLLREAERLVVNQDLCDPHIAIQQLKTSSLWPHN